MKYYAFALAAFVFAACNSNKTSQTTNATDTTVVAKNEDSDTVAVNNTSDSSAENTDKFKANNQIIPGKSIGNAVLNMNADTLEIFFGKADLSDVPTANSTDATYYYIASRVATFFQSIMSGTTSNITKTKFIECENYRRSCLPDSYDAANCLTACPAQ